MQKIGLQLKATLENITNLRPVGEDFRWYLKVGPSTAVTCARYTQTHKRSMHLVCNDNISSVAINVHVDVVYWPKDFFFVYNEALKPH